MDILQLSNKKIYQLIKNGEIIAKDISSKAKKQFNKVSKMGNHKRERAEWRISEKALNNYLDGCPLSI